MSVVRKADANTQANMPAPAGRKDAKAQSTPAMEPTVREKVKELLQAGQPQKALGMIKNTDWLTEEPVNAKVVCLLRLGRPNEVLPLLRPYVVTNQNLLIKSSSALKVNFATALLLDGNVSGCLHILDEMHDEDNPTVQQLQTGIKQWRKGLLFRQVLLLYCSDRPKSPVKLDFQPPGCF